MGNECLAKEIQQVLGTMFTFLPKIAIQAFYTFARSLSCQITLFPITYRNKIDTRAFLETASKWEPCLSDLDIVIIVFVRKRFSRRYRCRLDSDYSKDLFIPH
jgi:hypothetical protein